jgi:hypothetical protein
MCTVASQDHHATTGMPDRKPQWDTQYGSGLPGHQEGGSSYYPHGTPGPSHRARTSASTEFPHWYYRLERYISYGVDQAEDMVEGIRQIESRMDEFERV